MPGPIKNWWLTLIAAACACALAACDQKPNVGIVAGEYVGQYGGATETFVLQQDGSFTQSLDKDGNNIYAGSGKWRIVGGNLELEPFMQALDFEGRAVVIKPRRFDIGTAAWDATGPRIIFSDDDKYWANKQVGGSRK
ncbi:MAG: hypothetical protein NTW19_04720 [Planctomycetota bacterium]|nr:hypothetical protein [Planctomycetota bacterium]